MYIMNVQRFQNHDLPQRFSKKRQVPFPESQVFYLSSTRSQAIACALSNTINRSNSQLLCPYPPAYVPAILWYDLVKLI